MKKVIFLVALLSLVNLISSQIDSEQSVVNFSIKNFGFNKVTGTFTGFEGTVQFDNHDHSNSNFKVCVDAATVDTGNKKRDEHLRKDDFFDVTNHQQICFTSTEITKLFNGNVGNKYYVKGILTMRGVQKKIEFPFTTDDSMFKGSFTIDRTDFGVGGNSGAMVGKEVEIEIKCFVY